MSAWIVSKTHIDCLVQAGIDAEMVRPEEATEFGRMLWQENLNSIEARYPDTVGGGKGDFPGPVVFAGAKSVKAYRYEPLPGSSLDVPHVVNTAAACYDYQSCEHEGWQDSKAQVFVLALYELTKPAAEASGLKGPWGVDNRDAFLSADDRFMGALHRS